MTRTMPPLPGTGRRDASVARDREKIRKDLAHLQLAQRINASLAQRFLCSIRKAVDSVGKEPSEGLHTYNASGRVKERTASRVVNVLG
jgi:hypothetical protein